MPRLNIDVFAEPVVVPDSADFESLVNDYDRGTIASFEELEARLNAPGQFVRVNGQTIRETRQISEEQRRQLLAEARTLEDIRLTTQPARDYASYFSDIVAGRIATTEELQARFTTRPGSFVSVDRELVRDENQRAVTETRRVDRQRQGTLLEAKRLIDQSDETIARLADTSSYLDDISAGTIDTETELRARLVTEPGSFVRLGNTILTKDGRPITETRRVTDEQQEFLRQQLRAQAAMRVFLREARDQKSYLDDITAGRIRSREELAARLATAPGTVVRDNRDNVLREDGNPVRETRQVSATFAAELVQYYDSLAGLDASMRNMVGDILSGFAGPNAANQMMKERAASAINTADFQQISDTARTVFAISKLANQTKLRADVAQNIEEAPDDTRGTFELLSAFGLGDDDDRELVQDLSRTAYDARRLSFSRLTLAQLSRASSAEDYRTLLNRIQVFSGSQIDEDGAAAQTLRGFVYERELAGDRLSLLAAADPVQYTREAYQLVLGGLQVRASTPSFDFFNRLQGVIREVQGILPDSRAAALDIQVGELAGGFRNRRVREVLDAITELDVDDDILREQLLAFYKQYLLSRRVNRPQDYREAFRFEIAALRAAIAPAYEFDQQLGNNIGAFTQLSRRFKRAITPLLQALRGEGRLGPQIDSYFTVPDLRGLPGFVADERDPRTRYTLSAERIGRQRDLSDRESTYLESVELLSALNPHLVALAREAPALTSVYLESYFAELSDRTFEGIVNGGYVPLLQVGLGPNGIDSAGEILRLRPDLAANALYIDASALPGGPFAIPKGPAWELNSANSNQTTELIIANATPNDSDGETVRDYGSPMRWYPGERLPGRDVRLGSINTTVDYLPTPDAVTGSRYPSNVEAALVWQLQAAVLVNRCAMRTQVIDVVPRPEPGYPDRVEFILQHTYADGRRETKSVLNDWWIVGSGSGGPNFGFPLEGSRAQNVLAASDQLSGFPKLSDTLTAFTKLASLEEDQPSPGEVLVIYGDGNSTDTLLEYTSGLFRTNNMGVRSIKKIYIVGKGKLSPRPRYADNTDPMPRNGRGNLYEFVVGRVGDVDFADNRRDADSKLRLFDTDGNELRDRSGRPIRADNVISATGFRPGLDPLFVRLTGGRSLRDPGVLEAVTLPTNPNIAVADRFVSKRNGLLIGTASRSGFESLDKLAQLPADAREALLRNGAENAVAIGFRAPDTQAAVRLFLEQIPGEASLPPTDVAAERQRVVTRRDVISAGQTSAFRRSAASRQPTPRRRDVTADSSILSPLLLRSLSDIRFTGGASQGSYRCRVSIAEDRVNVTNLTDVPFELVRAVADACSDRYFATYAEQALAARRGSSAIEVTLDVRNGKIAPRTSFAQPS